MNNSFQITWSYYAQKQYNKLDKTTQIAINKWIEEHLENCTDPKIYGKALQGNLKEYWRYRIGDYRLISEIQNNTLKILIVYVGHRCEIYKRIKEDTDDIIKEGLYV